MKKIVPILSLIFSSSIAMANDTCNARGHILGGMMTSTLLYCPDYLEETGDTTWLVSPACNAISGTCLRCGEPCSQQGTTTRLVMWTRKK